jgi:CPA2 family monovalent cation:H+ antiporter-2
VWQFAVLGVVGFGAARLLGFDPVAAGHLALALTASSTLVCVRLLKRRAQMFDPFGRLVLGSLLVQDVLVIASVPLVAELGGDWVQGLRGLASVTVLGAASLAVRRWAAPLLQRVEHERELLLLGALTVLFLFMGGATLLGLPLVVGAFLAGFSLSRFPVEEIVRVELAPVGDFFTAIFFVALGALVRIPTGQEILHAAVLALLVVVVTPPLVALVAERQGFSARSALETGLMLSQTSEISLVIGISGVVAGHIGEGVFTIIALVTATTMLLTPFLSTDAVAWRLTRLHPSRWWTDRPAADTSGHVVLVGCGATGRELVGRLRDDGEEMVVLDADPAVLRALAEEGVPGVRGDVSDEGALEEAGVDRARAVVSTVTRPRSTAALLERAGSATVVLVRVFDESEARWVRERGGTPVLYSAIGADALMEWYDRVAGELEERLRTRRRDPDGGGGADTSPLPA